MPIFCKNCWFLLFLFCLWQIFSILWNLFLMTKLGKHCDFPAKIPYFSEIKKIGEKIQTLKRSSKWLNSPWMHCIIKIDGLIFCLKFHLWWMGGNFGKCVVFLFYELGKQGPFKWLFFGKWRCLSFLQV